MILEAREVRLRRGDRQKLEARCRSPLIIQRDLKRARIVLLAAQGPSTRSIAQEVGVQPRIASLWRALRRSWPAGPGRHATSGQGSGLYRSHDRQANLETAGQVPASGIWAVDGAAISR